MRMNAFGVNGSLTTFSAAPATLIERPAVNPSSMPPPNAALALRKRRRERSRLSRSTRPIARLEVMSGSFLVARRSPRRVLDPVTYAYIGPAAADVSGHRSVDVGVAWLRVGGKQCRGGHDLAGLAIAAIVVMRLPVTAETGVMHERTGLPSTWIVHAPHNARPQPNFVPVIPRTSRTTHSIGVSSSTSTLCVFPLTVMVNAMTVPPFLPTTQETQMGSDQKGEGESIGRWYRSVRRCQSARQSCCTRSPATTPRYDGRSPAEWRIVARWRHG